MKKFAIFLYGILCYVLFLGTFLYMIGFIGNLWVPKGIDSPAISPTGQALLVDLALLAVFAVQHTIMARSAFKRGIRKIIPPAAERSTYVLASSLALILLVYYWQPLGGMVWQVTAPAGVAVLYALFAAGWALLLYSTFLINHFDLFGLRQVWLSLQGREYTPVKFVQPWLYSKIRHPLYVGFFIGFWATPTMTITHLVFAVMASAYIVVGTLFEEHDLKIFHPEYAEYAKKVPRYIPRLMRR
ncbi:MAG: isoprenylcysteine carboxylmethyltransferase family protein [Gammaproteobacteria bacterium]|nr:isoprenylcysteine carboxylmethyltransferase family protein [Gammaproteobacteria bacterium]